MAYAVPCTPPSNADQFCPSHFATLVAEMPPAVSNAPAITSPFVASDCQCAHRVAVAGAQASPEGRPICPIPFCDICRADAADRSERPPHVKRVTNHFDCSNAKAGKLKDGKLVIPVFVALR